MNDFDALLAELAPLAKAMPTGDEKVAAAADEAGAEMPEGEGEGEGQREDEDEGEGEGDVLGKSFRVTLPDGTVQDAWDGTALVKSLSAEVSDLRHSASDQGDQLAAARTDLQKALSATVSLLAVVKRQDLMLKSLQADVAAFGATGRGRTASLGIHDKPGASVTPPAATGTGELMAKAMSAFDAGRISGMDVARVESNLARSGSLPADLLARIGAA